MRNIGLTEAIWAAWLGAIALSFAALEGWFIHSGEPTLSWTVWGWSKEWPLLPFVGGLLVGGLAVHFWWLPKTDKGF